ncbi:MAG TPA: hypothetical protein DHU75_02205 [Rikenellaceae bacterium]|nr:hypothetical protein [Rikenellaceae bacterium]
MIIEKILLNLQPFVVDLSSIGAGAKAFSAIADKQFFDKFENAEILGAHIEVDYSVKNKGASVDVSCRMVGEVKVPCDLCLEPVTIPVDTEFEENYIPQGNELDLSQDIYDYVVTSLPLRRVHPDGECNEETTKYISK